MKLSNLPKKGCMSYIIVILFIIFSLGVSTIVVASHDQDRRSQSRMRQDRDYLQEMRRNHRQYYPNQGKYRRQLPRRSHSILHRGSRYYYHGGVWYNPYRQGYRVVRPPIGLTVSILPPFYTRVWVGGIPYYYAAGTYYLWEPHNHVYQVVDEPKDEQVVQDNVEGEPLFFYPKKAQSDKQQADDRYACHQWSLDRTGYNPIMPSGNVPIDQYARKRSDYYRAMKACLEGREYTVR